MVSIFFFFVAVLGPLLLPAYAATTKVFLKDGRILEGKMAQLEKVDERAEDVGRTKSRLIVVLDDGLRYVYFPKYNIHRDSVPEGTREPLETFRTGLSFSRDGRPLQILGEYDWTVPFDRFGRRLLTLNHFGGAEFATQAITELTPRYVRARGIRLNNSPFVWDMRLATNSLPRSQITPILMNQVNPEDVDDRIRLVRFYIQGSLYEEAVEELDQILNDWQDDPEVKRSTTQIRRVIRQQMFQRRIDELELRWKSGQYELVKRFLVALEKNEDLPEQLYMSVRRMQQRYDDFEKKRGDLVTQLKSLHDNLPEQEKDDRVPGILQEIEAELSLNTIDRLSNFQLYAKDENITDSEKLAMGITGWFAGPNADNRRLTVAASLPETRSLAVEFLLSGNETARQKDLLERLRALESSRPDLLARILSYVKPPKDISDTPPERPGFYRFQVDNPLQDSIEKYEYVVQLPPEYDPNRRYPVIMTLNGLSQSPEMQIDFWSGVWRGEARVGHGARNGYIVVAPNWNPLKLLEYDFSAAAHAAVLFTLKDAFHRFSVDTDRVYLTGHGIGGTACWDIALAHPDLWAGAIPFNAVASKYIVAYQNNLQHVPFYLVSGELEGIFNYSKFDLNATVYNRYLARQLRPFEVTVVRFIGRGEEGFSDEILNVFQWMSFHRRNFAPLEFESSSMRPWDYYFWWVELGNLNRDAAEFVRDPVFWPEQGGIPKRMIKVTGKLNKAANTVQVDVGPKLRNVLVFLSPEMVDFNNKATVRVNGANYHPPGGFIEPDIETILRDVKTRGDRLHPFWAVLKNPRL